MKKVLIALDYNPTAQKVAETGYSFAKAMGAEIILLHILSDPTYYSSTIYDPIMGFGGYINSGLIDEPSIVEQLKKESQQFLDKSKNHLNDAAIQTLVKESNGDLASSILDAAKEIDAAIIVMGSHSKKWLEQIVMGSVAESVLHQTVVPIFIIPTKQQ
jgi:nucleotide-binding universal stress UspA family protein